MNVSRTLLKSVELDSFNSLYGPLAGFCEHGNEISGSRKKRQGIS
jgi:hypothetical protein